MAFQYDDLPAYQYRWRKTRDRVCTSRWHDFNLQPHSAVKAWEHAERGYYSKDKEYIELRWT